MVEIGILKNIEEEKKYIKEHLRVENSRNGYVKVYWNHSFRSVLLFGTGEATSDQHQRLGIHPDAAT